MQATADELGVDVRTIRNWERGQTRIPYSAFRLLRLLAGYKLVGKDWEGWSFGQNKLWTPEGRSFDHYHLRYVSIFISIARHFLKTREATAAEHSTFGAVKVIEFAKSEPLPSGEPSSATALSGVGVRQVKAEKIEMPSAIMEKAA